MKRLASLAVLSLAACGHSSADPVPAPPVTARPGDLGAHSAVIDHSGPNRGVVGALHHGPVTGSWRPEGCPGDVRVADGITDAAWGEEAYGTIDPSPHAVHTSFTFDTSSSIAAIWETDADTRATFLAWGTSPTKLDHFAQGTTSTNAPQIFERIDHPLLVHEAHACGLEPDRTYYFAVGGDGFYGNVYPVRTAPRPGSDAPFRFAVIGDSNGFPELFRGVVAQADTTAPGWTLFTGDMVHDGTVVTEWEWWFDAGGSMLARVPTMTVHGNHEAMATGYYSLFALPGEEEIYSFDYGNTHVVVLNDSPRPGEELQDRQAAFLDSDLKAAKARPTPPTWIVTSHHRAMFASDKDGGNDGVRAAWQPIYEKYGVDADFAGHNHHYESTQPISGTGVAQAGGVRYVVSGGGGALLDSPTPTPNPWTVAYYAGLSFAVVDVNGKTMTIQGYRSDGTKIEQAPVTLAK